MLLSLFIFCCFALSFVLLTAKLLKDIEIPWQLVFAPIWIPVILVFCIAFVIFLLSFPFVIVGYLIKIIIDIIPFLIAVVGILLAYYIVKRYNLHIIIKNKFIQLSNKDSND